LRARSPAKPDYQVTWEKALDKCKDNPGMLNHSSPPRWQDVDLQDFEKQELITKGAAPAVVAVTSITNLPVYYAFGKGNAATTSSNTVELLFPGQSKIVSMFTKEAQPVVNGKAQWSKYLLQGLYDWSLTPPQTDFWKNYTCDAKKDLGGCVSEQLTIRTGTAIHAITGQAEHFAYDLEAMTTVLAQTGVIPIVAVFKKNTGIIFNATQSEYDFENILDWVNMTSPAAILSRNNEKETYDMVDLTQSPPKIVTVGNIDAIFEKCFALVSLDPKLGASWQDLTLPVT
jgi:hypothetical protein